MQIRRRFSVTERTPVFSRHDLEAKIVKRCWEDEGFRKEFTANPSGAFVKYLEVPATSLPKIVVHEDTAGSWHIVLPSRPANASELSEQDLETVAGGDVLPMPTPVKVSWVIATVATAGLSGAASLEGAQGW
jgi:hypothetical protein